MSIIFAVKSETRIAVSFGHRRSQVRHDDRRAGDSSGGVMLTIPSGITFSFRSQALRGQMIPAHCSTPSSVPTTSAKQNPLTMRSISEEHTSELQSLLRISYSVFFF